MKRKCVCKKSFIAAILSLFMVLGLCAGPVGNYAKEYVKAGETDTETAGNSEGFDAVATIESVKNYTSCDYNLFRGYIYGKSGTGAEGVVAKYKNADGTGEWKEIEVFYPSSGLWRFYDDQLPSGYYLLSVTPYKTDASGERIYGTSVEEKFFARLNSATNLKAEYIAETGSVMLTWDSVSGAGGYNVCQYREDNGSLSRLALVSECSYLISNVETGKELTYCIYAQKSSTTKVTNFFEVSIHAEITFTLTEDGKIKWPETEENVVKNIMVEINEENFPDDTFRGYVSDKFDQDKNGWLYDEEIKAAQVIRVDDQGIKSLKGMEYLTNLKYLYCSGNELEELDVSCNTELTYIDCCENKLNSLIFGENYLLNQVKCSDNELTALDVSGLIKLEFLYCNNNSLTEIKFGDNRLLSHLYCSKNKLKELDLSEVPNLCSLACVNNEIETISFGEQDHPVYYLDVSGNLLSDIDLSKCPSLLELSVRGNNFKKLDLSKSPRLSKLDCSVNILEELDLSGTPVLKELVCDNNSIPSLDLSSLKYLKTLDCRFNPITELDISKNKLLENIDYKGTSVNKLDISENMYLYYLVGKTNSGCVVTDDFQPVAIDDEQLFPDEGLREYLKRFDYNSNLELDRTEFVMVTFDRLQFTDIKDFTGCEIFAGCKEVNIGSMGLKSFDFSIFPGLEKLLCGGNEFTELDVSGNPCLTNLDCSNNKLSSLDISNNTGLQRLNFSGNEDLAGVNIGGCPQLRFSYVMGYGYDQNYSAYVSKVNFTYDEACGGEKVDRNVFLAFDGSDQILFNPEYYFRFDGLVAVPMEITQDNPLKLEMMAFGEDIKYFWQYSRHGYDGWKTFSTQNPALLNDPFLGNERYMYVRCLIVDKYGYNKIVNLSKILINDGSGVLLEKTYFPDDKFRVFLKQYDKINDGYLSEAEIEKITSISIPSRSGITDLSGIEYLKKLESISLDGIVDSECLDLSSNSELESFSCNNCKIKKIVFGANEKLESIKIYGGGVLEKLVIDKLSGLKKLSVTYSGLSALDVSGNTALTVLNCDDNRLTTLDVSKNTALEELNCYHNKLTSLILGENTVLSTLKCGMNSLKKLDISKNTGLVTLTAYINELEELDISNNLLLRQLNLRENNLKELDVSRHANLMSLDCAFNMITALEFYRESGKNNTLTEIYCESNKLTALNITGLDSLVLLSCYDNKMGFLYLGGSETMRYLWDNRESDKTFKEVKEHAYECNVYYYFIKSIQNGENENSRIVLRHDMQMNLSTEVTYRLQIDEDLEDKCVPKDESAVFKVAVNGKGLIYQWYYMDKDGTEWTELEKTGLEDMRINTSEDLTLSELTVGYLENRNGMHVKCVLSDAYGQSLESSEAVLTYPSGTPSQSGEKMPGGTPSESGEQTPSGTPSESGEQTPSGTPSESGEQTPSGPPSESGEQTPGGTSSQSGETTPGGTPSQSGETTPGGTTSQSGEQTPGGTTSQSGEQTPGGTPASGGDDEKEVAGDVNGDGIINSKDVTELRRYLAGGWKVNVIEKNADVNGDGVINAKDVTMLRRYLAGGWGVVL